MPSLKKLYDEDPVAALKQAQEYQKKREAAAKQRKAIPVLTQDQLDRADARMIEKAKEERRLKSYNVQNWAQPLMLQLFSPSNYLGVITDVLGNDQPLSSALYRAFAGENSGIVTENYAREHPYLSTLANMAVDAFILGTAPMKVSAKPTTYTYTFRGGIGVDDLSGLRGGSPSMYMVTPQGQVVPRAITTAVPRTTTLPGIRFTTEGGFNTGLAKTGVMLDAAPAAEGTTGTATTTGETTTGTTGGTTSGTQPENKPKEEKPKEEPKKEEPKKTPFETLPESSKINKGAVDNIIESYKNGEISYDDAENLIGQKVKEVNIKSSSLARLKVTRKALEKVSSEAVTKAESELGGWPNLWNNLIWKSGSFSPKVSPASSILGRLFIPGAVAGGITIYRASSKEDTNNADTQDNNQDTEVKEENKVNPDTLKTQPTGSQTIEFNLQ